MIIKTYKYKLSLTATQHRTLNGWVGTCRFLYNIAKETKDIAYQSNGTNLSEFDLCKQLTDAKKEEGFEWIKEVPSQTLQGVIQQLDNSYKRFFEGFKTGNFVGFPKYAKKDSFNSFVVKSIRQDTYNRFILPKIGSVKYYNSRPIEGKMKRATLIRENNSWYISVVCEQELPIFIPATESQSVGIDIGISKFLALSNGEFVDNPRFYQNNKEELKRLQRSLSRKVKYSHNWRNVKKQINRLQKKIARQRKDWQHKLTTDIVKRFQNISVENLNIKGMSKRSKPVLSEDGKTYLPNMAAAKSGLNRELLDIAPTQFVDMLAYKSTWSQRGFIKVDARNTSRECSECGFTHKDNRKTQSKFSCLACSHEENADTNASKNIKSRGNTTLLKQLQVSPKGTKRA